MRSRQTVPIPGVTPVATILSRWERSQVDAAGEGLYRAVHRDSIEDVIRDLKEQRVGAVLMSVSRCDEGETFRVARMVREFPRIPAVALLTQLDQGTPRAVLSLGQCGIRMLVDVRQPGGWRELRNVLMLDRAGTIERLALGQLALDLAGVSDDCWHFFEELFRSESHALTVRVLARRMQILPSTLMSRFFRVRLPSPKRYLAMARLIQAARVFENPGLSIANVANHLDYSSPQSFGRHVRTLMNMTAVEFRQHYDGEGMLQRFREEMILPHLPTLRRLRPLTSVPRWQSVQDRSPVPNQREIQTS